MNKNKIFSYRYESFGGILHLSRPSALVWVDKDYMRSLGYPDSPLWDNERKVLSAPTEVHASVTGQCSAGCTGCYVDSYKPGENPEMEKAELGFEGNKKVIDTLCESRVFHLALGGGESLEMPWFFDLAQYAVSKKIIPNLTTNGFPIDLEVAEKCKVFGQINVSLDGIGDHYCNTRGIDGFEKVDRALTNLKKAKCKFGINTVVSSKNFDRLEAIVAYAKKKRVNQIELLRFKPAGRGTDLYPEMALTPEQAKKFYPTITALIKRYRLNIRLDCSFMPMVFYHRPDPRKVDFYSVAGCLGGDMLMGVRPDGRVNACSFAPVEKDWNVFDFGKRWKDKKSFSTFRKWHHTPAPPCDVCEYLEFCRGGCHVVANATLGDMHKPDPGCPIVRDYLNAMH